jgi:hypothetical protein
MNRFLRENVQEMRGVRLGPIDTVDFIHFKDDGEMVQELYGWTEDEADKWLLARVPREGWEGFQLGAVGGGPVEAHDVFMQNEERAHGRIRKNARAIEAQRRSRFQEQQTVSGDPLLTTPNEQEEYHRLYENSRRDIENDRLPYHKWSTERAQEELDNIKREYEPTYESEPTQRAWRSASIAAWTDAIREGFFDGNTGTEPAADATTEPDTGSAQVRRGDIEKAEAADTEEEVHAATGLSSEEHFITERNRHVEHFITRKDFGEKEAQAFLDMLKDDRRRGVMDTAPEHEKIGFEARIAALQALLDEGFFIAKRGLK